MSEQGLLDEHESDCDFFGSDQETCFVSRVSNGWEILVPISLFCDFFWKLASGRCYSYSATEYGWSVRIERFLFSNETNTSVVYHAN